MGTEDIEMLVVEEEGVAIADAALTSFDYFFDSKK